MLAPWWRKTTRTWRSWRLPPEMTFFVSRKRCRTRWHDYLSRWMPQWSPRLPGHALLHSVRLDLSILVPAVEIKRGSKNACRAEQPYGGLCQAALDDEHAPLAADVLTSLAHEGAERSTPRFLFLSTRRARRPQVSPRRRVDVPPSGTPVLSGLGNSR